MKVLIDKTYLELLQRDSELLELVEIMDLLTSADWEQLWARHESETEQMEGEEY